MQKVISIFGSASPQPGDTTYELARETGRRLAEQGFAVATGGYSGTMSGVSQGAAEAGGHVIGVTSSQIEQYRPLKHNQWVTQAIRYETLRERLLHLVTQNDGMICLPGGIGTLAELSLAWNLIQVDEIEKRPLILLGDIWRKTIDAFFDERFITPTTMALATFASTPQEAVAQLVSVGQ